MLAMAEQLKYESPHSTVTKQLELDEAKMKTYVIQKSGRQSPPSHEASKNEEVNLRSPEQPVLYDADSPELPGRMPARTSAKPYHPPPYMSLG